MWLSNYRMYTTLLQNNAGSDYKSYKIAKMHMFATQDKAKPYTGTMRLKVGGGHAYDRSRD
jgi:hypothetical protein